MKKIKKVLRTINSIFQLLDHRSLTHCLSLYKIDNAVSKITNAKLTHFFLITLYKMKSHPKTPPIIH